VVLPLNRVVDGHDVVFRTAHGSKLSAVEGQHLAAFEADHYNEQTRSGWSVLLSGRAEMVEPEADIQQLGWRGLYPWASGWRRRRRGVRAADAVRAVPPGRMPLPQPPGRPHAGGNEVITLWRIR
jgi:hypothetical protein